MVGQSLPVKPRNQKSIEVSNAHSKGADVPRQIPRTKGGTGARDHGSYRFYRAHYFGTNHSYL